MLYVHNSKVFIVTQPWNSNSQALHALAFLCNWCTLTYPSFLLLTGLCDPVDRMKELHNETMCSKSPTLPPEEVEWHLDSTIRRHLFVVSRAVVIFQEDMRRARLPFCSGLAVECALEVLVREIKRVSIYGVRLVTYLWNGYWKLQNHPHLYIYLLVLTLVVTANLSP